MRRKNVEDVLPKVEDVLPMEWQESELSESSKVTPRIKVITTSCITRAMKRKRGSVMNQEVSQNINEECRCLWPGATLICQDVLDKVEEAPHDTTMHREFSEISMTEEEFMDMSEGVEIKNSEEAMETGDN